MNDKYADIAAAYSIRALAARAAQGLPETISAAQLREVDRILSKGPAVRTGH